MHFIRFGTITPGILMILLGFLLVPLHVLGASRLQEAGDKTVIVIDPGHGGENLGTIENGHEEKSMTLVTALAMYDTLLQYDNVEVYLTRTEDRDMSLKERAQFARSVNADFLFSIHYNASENHDLYGAEVWVPLAPPYNGYGYQFGCTLLADLRETGLLIRGVKTRLGEKNLDYYGILRESTALEVPAVIIEHCHVDEPHDEIYCDSDEKLRDFGIRDAEAVAKYFGLKSTALNLDYSDHPLTEADAETAVPITINTGTEPEFCRIEFVDADYEKGSLTLSVSAEDSDSPLLYYSYSIDGGQSFGRREPWPGNDALTGSCQKDFVLQLEIPPGTCPEAVVRAYNNYDLYTESNHYESPWVFPYPPEPEEDTAADVPSLPEDEEAEDPTLRHENLDLVIAVVLFTIAVILTMMLVIQIAAAGRRKKRRRYYRKRYQRRNEDG